MLDTSRIRNLAPSWRRLQKDYRVNKNCIEVGRILLAVGLLTSIPATLMGGDVNLSDYQLDLDEHLDSVPPPLPPVTGDEWPGHVVALLGTPGQEWLVDLAAGQHWTNGVFVQRFEPAVCHVSEYDASFADDDLNSPLAVQYLNGSVFVTVRARPDLPHINFSPTSADFDTATMLIALANSETTK